jgi:hypothetical protein
MLWLTACFLLRTKDANYFGKANLCSVSSPFSYLDRFILIVFCYLSWLKVNLLWNKRSSFLGLLMPFFLILNSKDNLWSQKLWRSLSGFTCCIQGLGCCAFETKDKQKAHFCERQKKTKFSLSSMHKIWSKTAIWKNEKVKQSIERSYVVSRNKKKSTFLTM